jgi:broad specificity phosphatase PhoE
MGAHGGKRMHFVRHGEAEHNPYIVRGKRDGDEALLRVGRSILDPGLTALGRSQAAELRRSLETLGVRFDVLVTTPLSRALETSELAFSGLVEERFIVTPEATETASERLGGPQRGLSLDEMRKKHAFLNAARWDLSQIREGENWVRGDAAVLGGVGFHHPLPVEARLESLASWLRALPYERVVVVGHSAVFDRLLGLQMANCQLVEHAL